MSFGFGVFGELVFGETSTGAAEPVSGTGVGWALAQARGETPQVYGDGQSLAIAVAYGDGDYLTIGAGQSLAIAYATVTVAPFSYNGAGENLAIAWGSAFGVLPVSGRKFGPPLQSG